jgi:hypothetical protein
MGAETMKRAILGFSAILGLSVLAVGAPASGVTAATKAQLHVQVARCERTAKGHGKVTKANLSACKTAHLQVKDRCKSAGGATVVKINKVNYALRVGHRPAKVTSLCLVPAIVATTTTTTIPPTTTTTPAPAPPTTTTTMYVPPPPPTTAAPASCHPLSDGGNCYEPGEYCRDSDHGVTGVAGDGETITCEDNNGYRWEPS